MAARPTVPSAYARSVRPRSPAVLLSVGLLAPASAWADEPPPPETGARPLQVAGPEEPEPETLDGSRRGRPSDGAGPRLGFGRAWVNGAEPGYYGRFESEYFEVDGLLMAGSLVGVEGWGASDGGAGGGSVPLSFFGGVRGGPFCGPKAPVFVLTAGLGVLVVVFDRVADHSGFGLFSPFAAVTGGVELVPGLRLLADGRATYRWHWTAESAAEYQLGLTVGANSYLWDGE